MALLAAFMAVVLGPPAAYAQRAQQAGDQFTIHFKTRTFTPPPGLEIAAIRSQAGGVGGNAHFLVQFEALPSQADVAALDSDGLQLVGYVTGNTYIVSGDLATLNRLRSHQSIRWAGPLSTSDKISPDLERGNIGVWAQASQGRVALTVYFHPDVAIAVAAQVIDDLGGEFVGAAPSVPSITALFAPGKVQQIAREDAVQYVDVVDLPMGEHNDGSRTAANVAPLWNAPYNLDGTGVTVLVYDSGILDNAHADFAGRVLEFDGDATETTRNHSTHVAGTVGGDGSNSNGNDSAGNPNGGTAGQWAGMAPGVNFRSFGSAGSTDTLYNSAGDINADFTTAITNGIDLATMSLGNNVVPNGFPCSQLGDYTNTAILLDNIVRGSINGQQLIYFESAGNERGGGGGCGTYATIGSPSTSKNPISVGAINSNDNTMTGFSSWGPTDDGRLKPDIVAPGCQSTGDGGLTSTGFGDAVALGGDGDGNLDAGETQNMYVVMCGTSMATPTSAGAGALIIEQWRTTRGAASRPLPHTMKAILAYTATDLGNAGPDYQNGFGALNAQAAVDLVRADDAANLIIVDQANNGDIIYWTFNSDGAANVQVLLAWDDPAAAALAATTLVNDLDLRLISPSGTTFMPFVLDPANPANAATTGDDSINNVEQIIGTAEAGTWTVTVTGATVPTGPQQFTLVTPADASENRPPVADANGPYNTIEGTDVELDGTGSTDPDGDALTYAWDFDNDGAFDDATGATPDFTLVGQDGVFTVSLRVTDPDGAFDVDSTTVTVANVAPTVSLGSDSPKSEGGTITVTGTVSDPGWLELLTATIDWDDGAGPQALPGVLENVRPNATLTFSVEKVYGDNGTFTVQVCGYDDDTSSCNSTVVTITNVNPTAEIDLTGAILINGVPTFLASVGEDIDFSGRSTDPGSDDLDLSWDWGDGAPSPDVTTTYLVNPPLPDPPKSPSVQPRDVTDTKTHAFLDACFYTIGFLAADDDDGGAASDTANVIIVGNADLVLSAGYWYSQYAGLGTREFTEAELLCRLLIVGYMSQVFDEVTDASSILKAMGILFARQNGGNPRSLLDRQLLAAWLNFANGAIGLDELVDTDGDGVVDTTFADMMAAAEAVRLDATATRAEILEQAEILDRFNNRDS